MNPIHAKIHTNKIMKNTFSTSLLWVMAIGVLLLSGALSANATAAESPSTSSWNSLGDFLGLSTKRDTFLKPEQAFVLSVDLDGDTGITAHWDIAHGYYLYRDKFQFRILSPDSVKASIPVSPAGKKKVDEYFGEMEVYYQQLDIRLPLLYEQQTAIPLKLEISYQGCADAGFCYPPISSTIELTLPALTKQ